MSHDHPTNAVHASVGRVSRRELLVKGVVGAAAVAAGSIAGSGAARAHSFATPRPRRGGTVVWGLGEDPVMVAPFGDFGPGWYARENSYDSLLEWDRALNVRLALAEKWTAVSPTEILWTLRRGVRFHNGKELTAADAKYSFELQLAPPPPGSIAANIQVPAIERTEIVSKYVLRMRLLRPDARVFGYLAWNRFSSIAPEGLYQQVNVSREAIGTGPFRLVGYTPGDRVELVRHPQYWKEGLPYLDSITLQILTDEPARVAALRAGRIDGCALTVASARGFENDRDFRVLSNRTANFREIQMTVKAGESKPWHDVRVRQAVSSAVDRQEIINKVYDGRAVYSGHVAAGYGPWPLSDAELRSTHLKYDLKKAQQLMREAGYGGGFPVTMTTIATFPDLIGMAVVIKANLARIGIDVTIQPQEAGTFAAANAAGRFDWDLTQRGMRGDIDGYVSEFHPATPIFKAWFSGYRNIALWRLIASGRITFDQAKRLSMMRAAQKILLEEALHIPLVTPRQFRVVKQSVHNEYVPFPGNFSELRNLWR